ncbi:MAG: glycosyltransferase, partial [Bacteroidales bacterium]|nr:glycosyltransferase [Bacteroidales bacterium]
MKVCAIIPTYNNAATLPAVVGDVRSFVSDIIVVNDGSTDGTGDFLRT